MNQMYSQLDPEMSPLGDMRITASTMPRTIPMTMDSAVSQMVVTTPRRIRGLNR